MIAMPSNSVVAALLALVAQACNPDPRAVSVPVTEVSPASVPVASAPATEAKSPAEAKHTAHTGERPMLLVFSRDYCTPCQIMKPWVTEIANDNPEVDVVTINVDRKKFEHAGSFFKVAAVPSLIFIEAGATVVQRSEGLATKEQMSTALRELAWVP